MSDVKMVHPANQCMNEHWTHSAMRYRLRALFPQFKEERIQPANCTYFRMWLLFACTHTLHTSSLVDTQTMTSVVLFDFDCLHIDACSFFRSLQLLLFSLLWFASLLFAFVLPWRMAGQIELKTASTMKSERSAHVSVCLMNIHIRPERASNRFACTDASNKIASIIIITKQ